MNSSHWKPVPSLNVFALGPVEAVKHVSGLSYMYGLKWSTLVISINVVLTTNGVICQ